MRQLLMFGMILTPFSTGVDSGYPVVSFGLPFLFMAFALSLLTPTTNGFALPAPIAPALLSAAAVVFVITFFAFMAPYPDRSLGRVFPSLVGFAIAFRLLGIYRDDAEFILAYVLRALAISGGIMAAYFIVHLTLAIHQFGLDAVLLERYTGGLAALPWGASNIISAALIFPHIACYLLRWRYAYRWAGLIQVLIVLTVLLTMSRAGALVHGSLLILGCLLTRNFRQLGFWLASIFILIAMYARLAPESYDLLLNTRFSFGNDISNGRFDSFAVKAEYVLGNVMTPIGYYGSLFAFGLTSHNVFLTVLVEQGLLGLACFLVFCACCAWVLYRKRTLSRRDALCRRMLAGGALLAFCNLLVEDANFTQAYLVYFWMFFFAVMAFALQVQAAAAEAPEPVPEGEAYVRC